MKDYDMCIASVDEFLPFVDNWATYDLMSPKTFKKQLPELLEKIKGWLGSDKTYTIRFTIGILMSFCLDRWTHNKTIQKSIESYRITEEQKAYLRTKKIK